MVGGAFNFNGSGGKTVVENLTFNQCTSVGGNGNGGAVEVGANTTIVFKNVKFNENVARNNGGAIYGASGSKITVDSCMFFSNRTQTASGGAIFIDLYSQLTITNSVFENNFSNFGVAINTGANTTLNISFSTFSNMSFHKSSKNIPFFYRSRRFEVRIDLQSQFANH